MNTQHTPGDWTVSDSSIVAGDICIATITDDGGYEAPKKQRKANARLIAAAPKLLEALEKCLCYLERDADDDTEKQDWKSARAAVTKAKGTK